MANTLVKTDFNFLGQTGVYHGKVRDVYTIDDDLMVMVATDRISAFDVILPKGIPFKGQVLNQIAATFLDATADIVPNWKLAVPDPMVTVGLKCEGLRVEMIIRGYLTGSAWREYQAGCRELCGVRLPDGMRENQKFPEPIITPTTKAEAGHDENISRDEIIARGIVSKDDYETMELQNGVTLGYVDFSSSNYQGYDEISLFKGYYIENLDAPAHIKAIEFESLPVSSFAAPIVTVGNTLSENTSRTISEYSTEDGVFDQRFRYEISELGDYDYFRIEAQGDRTLYVASIRIEYEYEGSESAYSFSKTFLEELICDPTGTSAPDAEGWELLGLFYEDVDEAGKNLLKEAAGDENGTILEQCVARYDYVVGKYGSETYSDFIGRSPERPLGLSAGLNGGLTVDDTATWTCVAILFAAALTAGSAFIIKRRREGR